MTGIATDSIENRSCEKKKSDVVESFIKKSKRMKQQQKNRMKRISKNRYRGGKKK